MLIHRGFHLKASEGLNPAPTYLCRLKWSELYHASFLRQIHDQQMVLVVTGKGSLQILLMITDDTMELVVCLLRGNRRDRDENGIDHCEAVSIIMSLEPTRPSMGSRTRSVAVEFNPSAVMG